MQSTLIITNNYRPQVNVIKSILLVIISLQENVTPVASIVFLAINVFRALKAVWKRSMASVQLKNTSICFKSCVKTRASQAVRSY